MGGIAIQKKNDATKNALKMLKNALYFLGVLRKKLWFQFLRQFAVFPQYFRKILWKNGAF